MRLADSEQLERVLDVVSEAAGTHLTNEDYVERSKYLFGTCKFVQERLKQL